MALRDQPYLPLYVQDFLTDEKLIECSASATGVYIRLMCIMHKSEDYGVILLKQKDKQTDNQIKNFAIKLVKQMPYSVDIIESSLTELLNETVITLDGDMLYQKRMVKDDNISNTRASSGRKGGAKKVFASNFAKANSQANTQAKVEANTEYENEVENEYENDKKNRNEDYFDCFKFLEQEFCTAVAPSIFEKLSCAIDEFNADIVKLAITESVAQEKRSWKYVEAILNNWRTLNVRTLGQAKMAIANFRAAKLNKGGGPNGNITGVTATGGGEFVPSTGFRNSG